MPEMMSSPVSAFSLTEKVGSSMASTSRTSESFFLSDRVLGSMATEITGSGKCIRSRRIGKASTPRVSPVRDGFRPMTTAMSPASTWSTCWGWLACMRKSLFTRSRFFLLKL